MSISRDTLRGAARHKGRQRKAAAKASAHDTLHMPQRTVLPYKVSILNQ